MAVEANVDLDKERAQYEEWSKKTEFQRVVDRLQFRRIQAEALLMLWEVMEAINAGKTNKRKASAFKKQMAELSAQLGEWKGQEKILTRSSDYKAAYATARWALHILAVALEVWGK